MAMLSTMQSLNKRAFGRAMPAARPVQVARPLSRTPLRIQNLRVNNVEIPNNKKVEISLQYIYGIGSTTAKAILRDTVSNRLRLAGSTAGPATGKQPSNRAILQPSAVAGSNPVQPQQM
eukprot:GHUV01043805.1.p1 GENE.GHUV01043805.1~~GHUV01043805.1.p1  ORF type:complete len:119 (-),score=33.34 GHUV01043805.1:315-671(-)